MTTTPAKKTPAKKSAAPAPPLCVKTLGTVCPLHGVEHGREKPARRPAAPAAVHVAYRLESVPHGDGFRNVLAGVAQFGTRNEDELTALRYALDNDYKVTTLPAGVPLLVHLRETGALS